MDELKEGAAGFLGCLMGIVWIAISLALPTLIGLAILDAVGLVDVW